MNAGIDEFTLFCRLSLFFLHILLKTMIEIVILYLVWTLRNSENITN